MPASSPQRLPADLAAAYGEAMRELATLRRERATLARKLNADLCLRAWQVELLKLQRHLEAEDLRMIVLFEGRDAAGKGGAIRRVTRFMNEKHYRVVALGRPTEDQRTQWYFQRYVAQFPTGGEIVLFDRSWYNRAMVERVFGFCSRKEYQDFLRGVTGFEKDLVRQGTVLVKLYFSVTKEEQAHRFERRLTDPLRRWKLSEIDMQAQNRWDDFTNRKYEMLVRTGTKAAPWLIIRSNDKQRARLNTIKVILNAVDYKERDPDLDFTPDPRIVVPGADEVAIMRAELKRSGRFAG
ncbi:polyphosphate kinase 2 [Actinoplanes sp. NPDC051475]|uniref:polyphosphate kinase 2 n=1 Tax=Actinoplanes sp. NPDC051475 TaxID=3157225 RepID=UPI0034509277